MSGYRGRPHGLDQRPQPARPRDDFYDDRRSRSRSSEGLRSSPSRTNAPHDAPRGPSRQYERDQYRSRRGGSPGHHNRNHGRPYYSDRRRSPSPRRGRNEYYDRDRASSSPRSRSRSQDGHGERASSRGRPSKEIMLEGLAPHLTENDIIAELQQHYHVAKLDDVRIIRDRFTKQSRRFGFLRFPAQEEAESFMDANYPTIYLYGENSKPDRPDDAKVRIAFGKERKEARVDDGDWVCKICNINNFSTRQRCFRCSTLRSDSAVVQKNVNVGDNDAAADNTPSQFLLFRGLETSVSEELFAKGVAKLNKPHGSNPQSTVAQSKKGAKVASTTGDANLGAKEGTLRRVMLVRDRKTNESWRYGFAEYASVDDAQSALFRFNSFDRFTIASKQVLVSYIHAGVFIPMLNPTPSTERFAFSPIGNPGMKLAYWDEEAYVTELAVSMPEVTNMDAKTKQQDVDMEGIRPTKDGDKPKKRKAQEANPSSVKKPAPAHLQFWSNRHAELHGIKAKSEDDESQKKSSEKVPPSKSYADPQRNCCYLCMRQFNSASEVNTHERLSDLHSQNLKDEAKVKRAEHKLKKHGVKPSEDDEDAESAPEYRDRARERRKIYGVVNKKGEVVQPGTGKTSKEGRPGAEADEEKGTAPQQSKGAALLSKMGYNPGQGLGAQGTGMTAPIAQDIYVAGVGLGAEGGKVGDAVKEAERNTRGDYSAFAERARDGARERYKNLG